jgi:hypothetical protein
MELQKIKQTVNVIGLVMPDPDYLTTVTSDIQAQLIPVYENSKEKMELELQKLKAFEDKISGTKREINDYLASYKESLGAVAKQNTKLACSDGSVLTVKVSESVEIVDIEKLPGSCIKLKKEADKATVKAMISTGEIQADAAIINKNYSANLKKPKEK